MSSSDTRITQIVGDGTNIVGRDMTIEVGRVMTIERARSPLSQLPPAPQKKKCTFNDKKIFIVHGHDGNERYVLKNYLQNTLNYPEPIILSDTAGRGRTIIECFEDETEHVGLVFVLATPDDLVNDNSKRARQNVIFELGYCMGKLGRKSGRVIVLRKGDVDIPSDLEGILFIKIDNGIEAAGEQIRRAIEAATASLEN